MKRHQPQKRATTVGGRQAARGQCTICGGPKPPGRGRSYCAACREQRDRESYKVHRERKFENKRDYGLYTNHRIRLVDYRPMWLAQGGRCAGCGVMAEVLHIDHDHSCCGARASCELCRRGLLCGDCNRLLGLAKENPATLTALVGYLGRYGHR